MFLDGSQGQTGKGMIGNAPAVASTTGGVVAFATVGNARHHATKISECIEIGTAGAAT